jgi:F-type H+-transporting ATPase subunit a
MVPRGLQNVVETIIEFFLGLIDGITQDKKQTSKFFALVFTFFIFILVSNYLGLFPGFGTIGVYEQLEGHQVLVPFFRSANSDLNVTLALAIVSVLATQVFGILAIGVLKYGKKFLNFSSPFMFFVGILEFISELAKFISFSFRLFGNVFAGEVLLVVISFLIPYIAPVPFYFLELFVGLVQAAIFSLLTIVFLKFATTDIH